MAFKDRLKALRKERGLTQAALSEASGVHHSMIKSYEVGATKPTMDAMKKLAVTLSISADRLLFEPGERAPCDEFNYVFEALKSFDPEERTLIERMLRGLILQKQTGARE